MACSNCNGFFNVDAGTRKNIHPFTPTDQYTFRKTNNGRRISVFPRYNYTTGESKDIAFKDLNDTGMEAIIRDLPSIKIREYTQDLKVTQILNLIQYGVQGFNDAGAIVKGMAGSAAYAEVIISAFTKEETWNTMFGSSLADASTLKYPDGVDQKMLTLTYNLYYHIMGHETTNKYEVPFISRFLYETNGMEGWPNGPESGWEGIANAQSMLGKALNYIGSNYKIITEPIWRPLTNSNGTNIEVTFHLFNDSEESAINNYIFVQTITSHNMPLQYGIIQQPPSAYEIQITGGKRLFMCSGKFSVSNIGVVRNLQGDTLNKIQSKAKKDDLIHSDNVRIPDVYEVKLTFKSLLPDVFNDFMYQFVMADSDTFSKTGKEPSVFEDQGDKILNMVDKIIGEAKAAAKASEEKEIADANS